MTEAVKKEIAKRIRNYRHKSGLSQAKLAKKAGVQTNTVARLEGAKNEPKTETIEKLAKAFDIKSSDLLPF